jgi:hypothetical protein
MVVEDEFFIRILTSDALTDAGFDVTQAGHAEQAKLPEGMTGTST